MFFWLEFSGWSFSFWDLFVSERWSGLLLIFCCSSRVVFFSSLGSDFSGSFPDWVNIGGVPSFVSSWIVFRGSLGFLDRGWSWSFGSMDYKGGGLRFYCFSRVVSWVILISCCCSSLTLFFFSLSYLICKIFDNSLRLITYFFPLFH